ncbi:MAG TPA: type II secretion system F family protein [Solirubrobacteraceae bacterium]|nr:type II secretion system F family protein [Solirubrobacteraceae bacterium]
MAFLFVIGVLLLAVSAGFVVRAIALTRIRTSAQLQQIDTYGFSANAPETSATIDVPRPNLRAYLDRLAGAIGKATKGPGWRTPVDTRSLRAAGVYSLSSDAFHGYRVIGSVLLPTVILLPSIASGSIGFLRVVQVIVIFALAWLGPAILVRTRAQRRMDDIDRALPELIDVLIATMEAGLGFAGSLQMVAERFSGVLGKELRLTLQEQRLGLTTDQALANLLERCDTPSMRAFVRAVMQGESLGVSIATMMRNLATETRKRRRQNAHAQIQKAPVKMLFPLVFLIFPALMIVLLYPAISHLLEQLGG